MFPLRRLPLRHVLRPSEARLPTGHGSSELLVINLLVGESQEMRTSLRTRTTQGARQGARKRTDSGASLVEFAIVLPFLLLLILGAIEFAWLFSQNLDVRHGAREGARLVAVNYPDGPVNPTPSPTDAGQTTTIANEVCSRMDVSSGASVTLASPTGALGGEATATVSAPANTLSGFLDWAIPSSLILSSTVEIRIEQPAGWDIDAGAQACP